MVQVEGARVIILAEARTHYSRKSIYWDVGRLVFFFSLHPSRHPSLDTIFASLSLSFLTYQMG